ncbi:MAG: ABC transporter ATP-binding protein/permease [Agathobacter sp.]|nr:ABC transporter ATP-binding protein/permease [Agathobacter sp.]
MIQINKLHKYYNKGKENEIHVINDTTLSLPETGMVCILGESGSGKTTLLNTMGGLDDYTSGTFIINETTLENYSQEKVDILRTKHFAYVFQNYYLLSEHTVDYNIRLILNMYDMTEEEKTKRIDYVLEAVDMLKYKKRQISQLSGGQQQRIAIARALAKTPKVIFADEPTGNLDEANTIRVMQILKSISQKCLVVIVTHETRLADAFADRVIRVESGKVVSDTYSHVNDAYEYQDDATIYLQEFEKESYEMEHVQVEMYHSIEQTDHPSVKIRIIEENGRYYIQACSEEVQVSLLPPTGKKQVVDAKKPVMNIEEENDFVFELEELPCKRMPSLYFREIIRVAIANLRVMGKQQVFLIVCFLAMAVLFVLTVSDILTLNAIDVHSVVKTDSRYVSVETEKNGGFSLLDYNVYFEELMDGYLEDTDIGIGELRYLYDTDLYFKYQGFEQMQDIKAMLTGYSYAHLEEVSEEELLFGRMPERPNEVVVDIWVLENFISKEPSIAQVLPDAQSFLGKEISVDRKQLGLKIVGICDKNSPNIYTDKCTRLSITMRITDTLAGVEMLKNTYPEMYGNLELEDDEVMVSESYFQHILNIGGDGERVRLVGADSYKIVGTYPDEFGMDCVITPATYEKILRHLIVESKRFIIVSEDKEQVLDYFENLPEETKEKLQIFVTDHYGEEMAAYEEARAIKVDARLIITISVFVVSLVMLYFSMQSNAMKKIEDIMVYRLLGIQKSSILFIFAVESVILTLCISVPVVLLTSVVLKFVVSIPSLELSLVYPWSAAIGIIIFLFIINIITGILPIISLVRKPPAQLAS